MSAKDECRLHGRSDPHPGCQQIRSVPGIFGPKRRLFRNVNLSDEYDGHDQREPATLVDAQVASSQLINRLNNEPTGMHAPVLDIDFQATLAPSSTEGHYHLYLDIEVPWEKYSRLLVVLAECGVIEEGYASASIERQHTAVRLPWVKKETS